MQWCTKITKKCYLNNIVDNTGNNYLDNRSNITKYNQMYSYKKQILI